LEFAKEEIAFLENLIKTSKKMSSIFVGRTLLGGRMMMIIYAL